MKTDMAGRDLSSLDLRGADFTQSALFGTDLRGSQLHGCAISIDCATFEGVKLDDRQVAMFLLLLAQADTPHAFLLQQTAQRICGDSIETVRDILRLTE